jgi:3-hydroxyisobutyrate dehydrogenase-like beta-hydroxyacid dehydrogenase
MDARNVAFIGLGTMGYPMAGHLAKAGHRVTVYNRTRAKAAQWTAQHGGATAPTPAAAAANADIVLVCVGNDDDVRAVAHGHEGAFATMRAGLDRPHHRAGASRRDFTPRRSGAWP